MNTSCADIAQVHDSDDELDDQQVRKLRSRRRVHRESKLAELDKLLGDPETRAKREIKHEEQLEHSGVWGVLHGKSAVEQMLSPWFILLTILTVLQMLRMNFFIATVKSQYEYMLGSDKLARRLNGFFDMALPVSITELAISYRRSLTAQRSAVLQQRLSSAIYSTTSAQRHCSPY